MIGINGTRAMTAFNSKTGGFHLTTVGRVQTPTLALVIDARREDPRVQVPRLLGARGHLWRQRGSYAGRWFDENSRRAKATSTQPPAGSGSRARRRDRAKCEGKTGVVEEEAKPSTQLSPLLFDLTSLQREANGRFGFRPATRWASPRRSTKAQRF